MARAKDDWKGRAFFCSWSGGKDCAYALHKAVLDGAEPRVLLTMCTEDGRRTRTHHLPIEAVRAQATALGLPLIEQPSSWKTYAADFKAGVKRATIFNVDAGLTGDTEFGRKWLTGICNEFGLASWLPLWEVDPESTFKELLGQGFKALVVAASDSKVGKELVGRTLDEAMVVELRKRQVDVLGEYNEYHTFVIDGPIFERPVSVELAEVRFLNGYWLQEICVARQPAGTRQ